MIRPLILLALGLSLLGGCGRGNHPSVRQDPARPEDQSAATASSSPSQDAADAHPPATTQHRPRPKRTAGTRSKLAEAMRSKRADANPPKTAAGSPAKGGGATRPKAGQDPNELQSRDVQIGGMRLVAPKNWTRERPPLNLILAQFRLPRAAGDPSDAELTVAAAMENDPQSLERLREQLKEEAEEGSVEHLRIGGNEIILVDTTEDESAEDEGDPGDKTSDPSPPPASEGRVRVLNAMLFLGGQVYFVTCTGPEKTVGARAGEFRAFLETMKSVE